MPALNGLTALQTLNISYNTTLSQLPAVDKLPNLLIADIRQDKGLNDLQLHKSASLKKLFLPGFSSGDEPSKTFAESLEQQRQGLNPVEIEFGNDFVFLDAELEKLKQP